MSDQTPDTFPLLSRPLNQTFAFLSAPSRQPSLQTQPREISVARFYQHVCAVAEQLPERPFAINLCENRYLFCVAFCAVLVRQHTNLLPPNRASQTLKTLSEKHNSYYLVDADFEDDTSPILNLASLSLPDSDRASPVHDIPADHLAAICYTSGSTGESKPIHKTWSTFYLSNLINSDAYTQGLGGPIHQLATVPAQHMWGMETTVLMPLLKDVVITDSRPLYPADVLAALQELPEPRMLVSTPIHLRALSGTQSNLPALQRILCATSPLAQELAAELQQQSGGDVVEVYGCSELGPMACRFTADTDLWTLFRDFSLSTQDDNHIIGRARHIQQPAQLGDFLQLVDEQHFRIAGRTQDLINIGGKRGSLADINRVLLQFDGIEDGVVFQPSDAEQRQRLACMVVLKPEVSRDEVIRHFREHVDPAFVPRPLLAVDSLPRSENGKLPLSEVQALYQKIRP